MNRRITKSLIKVLVECFSDIEEFTLTKTTQLKLIHKCRSLFEERDKLTTTISNYKKLLNPERDCGKQDRHARKRTTSK